MSEIFSSIVNNVSLINLEGEPRVKKEYLDIARGTGIAVPKNRWLIERNVLNELKKITDRNIEVPKVIDFREIPPCIYLEFINGIKLTNTLPISADLFWSLGDWVSKVEKHLYVLKHQIFDDHLDVQSKSSDVLKAYKGGLSNGDFSDQLGVSLGDTGLGNIIYHHQNKCFVLIDFEFCHISVIGRDVGQLAAEMDVYEYDVRSIKALIDGYAKSESSKELITKWRNIFREYYLRKKHKK